MSEPLLSQEMADAKTTSEVLIALGVDSKEDVERIVEGGREGRR